MVVILLAVAIFVAMMYLVVWLDGTTVVFGLTSLVKTSIVVQRFNHILRFETETDEGTIPILPNLRKAPRTGGN